MAKEISKAQRQAVGRYEAANYDKVLIRLPKGEREKIKEQADAAGLSLNRFIIRKIEWGTPEPTKMPAESILCTGGGTTPPNAKSEQEEEPRALNLEESQALPSDALKKARQAAKEAGETLQEWLDRAINDTAARDELLRQLKR